MSPIQKKESQPSIQAGGKKNTAHVEKKTSIKATIKVEISPQISQPIIRLKDHHSYVEEAIYMNEDLFRVEEKKLSELLHRSVGAITFFNAHHQRGFGSGILISQDIVLTAAHNIYERRLKQQNKRFKFYLGANGVTQNYHQIQNWRYPEQFKNCSAQTKVEFDYAIIKLKKLVDFDQFLPMMAILCPICILKDNKKKLKIYGFPCAYPLGPKDMPGYPRSYKNNFVNVGEDEGKIYLYQYGLTRQDRIRLFDVPGSKICYEISTLPGQSGSAVIIDNRIIAVHVGDGQRKQFNMGRIVDQRLLKNLQRWRDQLKAKPFSIQQNDPCDHYPFTLTFKDKNKISRVGSGVVISKNLVLTAAHNLYDRQGRAENEDFKFYLGADGMGEKFFQIKALKFPQKFKTCKISSEAKYDYALVSLKEEVPLTQFMEISLPCPNCILLDKLSHLEIYGFPISAPNYGVKQPNYESLDKKGQKLRLFQYGLFRVDKIIGFQQKDYKLKYTISTFKGQRGSPLVINSQVIGFHKSGRKVDESNGGRLIDRKFVRNVEVWSKQLNGIQYKCIKKQCCHNFIPRLENPLYKIKNYEVNKMPYRSICGVTTLNRHKEHFCWGGVLLSKNLVLTCANVCFDKKLKDENTELKVYFGENNGISRHYYEVQQYRYPFEYKTCKVDKKMIWNYALLKLKTQVDYDQFPKISLPCRQCIMKQNESRYSQIFGFPTQYNTFDNLNPPIKYDNWKAVNQEMTSFSLVQYGFSKKNAIIRFPSQFLITYDLRTTNGLSGSPVMIEDSIIAVHLGSRQQYIKTGRLITPDFIANIKQWSFELKGEQFQVTNEDHICKYSTEIEGNSLTESLSSQVVNKTR